MKARGALHTSILQVPVDRWQGGQPGRCHPPGAGARRARRRGWHDRCACPRTRGDVRRWVRAGEGLATQRIGTATRLRVVDTILSGTHEFGDALLLERKAVVMTSAVGLFGREAVRAGRLVESGASPL
ncbi:MAG: hypothetical protein L0Z62_06270 [Gemmataceae bacterium]|nr:hypothetical protein [Gemmataceae bacterium]